MKRLTVGFLAVLFMATICFAQASRNPAYNNLGKSNFANVGVQGLDVSGNPGYIEMVSSDTNGKVIVYYLWVDDTGDLRIASYVTISAFASFPTGDWTTDEMTPSGGTGAVVGAQS